MPFSRIAGHARLLTLLSRAIARQTLPPSLILSGPSGIGKKRVAVASAQALNCLQPHHASSLEIDGCGVCLQCTRIERGVHPDVIIVEPDDKASIGVASVREVIERTAFRPFEGKRRVVIIDEADAMTDEAQSALLKTLEEPPAGSIFLLVSSQPDALLPTVRSRCPNLRFSGLAPADIAAVLVRDHEYDEADARSASVDADGSLGLALAARSADAAQAVVDARDLLMLAARNGDPSRRVQAIRDLFPKKSSPAIDREYLAVRLRAMSSLLRDLSILLVGGSRSMVANGDLESDLSRLEQHFDPSRADRAYVAVDQALAALERNASAKVVADWLVVQL